MVGREILPWSRGVGVPRKDKVQAKRGRSLSATARQRRRAVTDALMLASSEHATSGAPADERLGARRMVKASTAWWDRTASWQERDDDATHAVCRLVAAALRQRTGARWRQG